MPTYDRKCEPCGEIFEVVCKIAEKETKVINCPYCDSVKGGWMIGAPVSSMRPERFSANAKNNRAQGFKEVIQKVQERNRRTTICER